MTDQPLLIVILAAGKGVRMRSERPKVLHAIAGRSMLAHVLDTVRSAGTAKLALVVAPGMEAVRAEAARVAPSIEIFEQATQAGTAHAVLAARPALERHEGDVIVLFADTPLVEPATLRRLVGALDSGAQIAALGFEAEDATGYGRLLLDDKGHVIAVREHRDATEAERSLGLCIGGGMAFRVPDLVGLLSRIGSRNAQGEYYLTDIVAIAAAGALVTQPVRCSEEEALGINSREQLAAAEAVYQTRARRRAMEQGATLVAPETVWLSFDTAIGRDVTIEPNVFFGPGVVVEDGAHIMANCHFVGARIRAGARVGPFARFRPGTDIGAGARVGNFVEVKNATLEAGAKANHLSYIGDGRVGEGTNIGAGTIFCNYDGFNKHFTDVGKGAFVGSNTSLVAPVKIGDGAYIGSGSVISKNVEADALALERSPQDQRPGWAAKFRAAMGKRKKSG
ncbi:MAG TPA: bifunctional UDP-N-acetylglucosamine diphosphorylase/glucosamine-1-phosphate N-acetyltransferase GlmU [Hyphomicrobiaceae bacterium]|nr:bifunctional UDP-N-acetylglucosamine diphosphorylase/glucosamine-1-phosphate N-acetyltransferase GlmU [Hyphomicrobiaceae bacterium]